MNNEIHVVVRWKQQGGTADFRRPDLVARYLREHMPKILFRVDLDPKMREAEIETIIRHMKAGRRDLARVAITDKPDGWDDYYLALNCEVQIA